MPLKSWLWENRSILWGPARLEKATHEDFVIGWNLKSIAHKGTLYLDHIGNVQTKENTSPGVYNMFLSRHTGWW